MKISLLLASLTAALVCLDACKEKEKVQPVTPDTEKPVITPEEPSGTGVVMLPSAGMLHVKGQVTDNVKVQEIHVELNDAVTQFEHDHKHILGTGKSESYQLHLTLPTVQDTTHLVLSVGAEDPEGNYAEIKRNVLVLPL